ncbi:MAG: DUF1292 domain-containing protein [Lachnospiraceae bacterium]|nr:DUF1292 domain-containing protein [Lachnospiraceae bacterium]
MAENKKTIMFTDENNEQIAFEVLEQTTITGINYLLVCDAHDEEESDAFILKEIKNNDDDIVYDEVIDDIELQAVAKVFGELLDEGFDIQL